MKKWFAKLFAGRKQQMPEPEPKEPEPKEPEISMEFGPENYDIEGAYGNGTRWGYMKERRELTIWGSGVAGDVPELQFEVSALRISGVEAIGSHAFFEWFGLDSVMIGKGVKTIHNSAFARCEGLREVIIGDGVTTIEGGAFCECEFLDDVIIPDSVTTIGDRAFEGCNYMRTVTIGNGVTSIGKCAFSGRAWGMNLDVYYKGTEEQWNAIEKGSESLSNSTIHFNN